MPAGPERARLFDTGEIEILGENNAPALDKIAWYGGNSGVDFELANGVDSSHWPEKQQAHTFAGTHPVAQKQINPWGLYDMLGNVWEWMEDHWHNNYHQAPEDGSAWQGDAAERVLRGGSWSSDAHFCRSANRLAFSPDEHSDVIGFRCARVQASQDQAAQPAYSGVLSLVEPEAHGKRHGEAVQLGNHITRMILTKNLSHAQGLAIRSDQQRLLLQKIHLPPWASAMGRDIYGLWAELSLDSEQGEVVQRLRWIPPGQFLMGSPENEKDRYTQEGPQHLVTLSKGYWLFDTAVTQVLWETIMGTNPSHFKGGNHPVDNVSWHDSQKFIAMINQVIPDLNLSLPTEAQWEYACRAGTTTAFHMGEDISPEQVNYNGNFPYLKKEKGEYRRKTVAVKQLAINPWGLYQMHGNIWEWCLDGRRQYTKKNSIDPIGSMEPEAERVLRGGSWGNDALNCRSAFRIADSPDRHSVVIGFRCARADKSN